MQCFACVCSCFNCNLFIGIHNLAVTTLFLVQDSLGLPWWAGVVILWPYGTGLFQLNDESLSQVLKSFIKTILILLNSRNENFYIHIFKIYFYIETLVPRPSKCVIFLLHWHFLFIYVFLSLFGQLCFLHFFSSRTVGWLFLLCWSSQSH